MRQFLQLAAVVAITMPGAVFGQYYTAGPAPSIGPIEHQCTEEYPSPRSRTTIGIGETMDLWVDENTWNDPDYLFQASGGQQTVPDGIGDTTWSVLSGEGTVYPTMGTSTVLTADMAESDNTITVEASVEDSPLGDDQPVKKNIAVDAKIPNGMQIVAKRDAPEERGQPGDDKIGMRTYFTQQVKPVTVNFSKVKFREVKGAQVVTWPDGTNHNVPATTNPHLEYSVSTGNGIPNLWVDMVGDPARTKNLIKMAGNFVDFTWTRDPIEHQFENKAGWKKFNDQTHPREYVGATRKGRSGVTNDGSTEWGSWQGPYK